ncbi:MAG: hypothetical protein R3309_02945 [Reinekea sp.]|nr:hypothetical protein [Reinekea sp.]
MLGLARFAMKSPLHTGILAALFAVVPLLYVVSAALVALTTLRQGLTAGTRILVFAMVGGLVSWQLSGIPLSLLVLVIVTLLAGVLRVSQSWNRTLLVGAFLGLLLAFLAQMLFQEQFNNLVEMAQKLVSTGAVDDQTGQFFELLKPMVGFVILSSQLLEALLSLLLARYWQAGLYNPGGLTTEMHAMRFTRHEVVILSGAALIALLYLPGALMLFGIPFIFAGMALMHGIVAKLKLGGQWLVALYIGLVLFNQIIVPLLMVAVVADSFFDVRSRIPERSSQDDK